MEFDHDPQDHYPVHVEDANRAQLGGDVEGAAHPEGDVEGGAHPEGDVEGCAHPEGDVEGGAHPEGERENVPHPAGWWERNRGWVVVAVGAAIVVGGIVAVYCLHKRITHLESWKKAVTQKFAEAAMS